MIKNIFFILFFSFFIYTLYSYRSYVIPQNSQVLQASTTGSLLEFPKDHSKHDSFQKEWWNISLDLNVSGGEGSSNSSLPINLSFSRIKHLNKNFNNLMIGVLQNTRVNSKFTPANSSGNLEIKNEGGLKLNFKGGSNDIELSEIEGSSNLSKFTIKGNSSLLTNVNLTFEQPQNYRGPIPWGTGRNGVCSGNISIFEPNDTFMYSIPGYRVSGSFTYNNINYTVVNGKAWLDHKWFDNNTSKDYEVENWDSSYYIKSMFSNSNTIADIGIIKNFRNTNQSFYTISRNQDGTYRCGSFGELYSFHRVGYPKNVWVNLDNGVLVLNSIHSIERYFYYVPGFREPEIFANFYSNTRYYDNNFNTILGTGFIETGMLIPTPATTETPFN